MPLLLLTLFRAELKRVCSFSSSSSSSTLLLFVGFIMFAWWCTELVRLHWLTNNNTLNTTSRSEMNSRSSLCVCVVVPISPPCSVLFSSSVPFSLLSLTAFHIEYQLFSSDLYLLCSCGRVECFVVVDTDRVCLCVSVSAVRLSSESFSVFFSFSVCLSVCQWAKLAVSETLSLALSTLAVPIS